MSFLSGPGKPAALVEKNFHCIARYVNVDKLFCSRIQYINTADDLIVNLCVKIQHYNLVTMASLISRNLMTFTFVSINYMKINNYFN